MVDCGCVWLVVVNGGRLLLVVLKLVALKVVVKWMIEVNFLLAFTLIFFHFFVYWIKQFVTPPI